MATLVKDIAAPIDLTCLYWQAAGILADAYSVRFQIWNASAGLPGTQVLPVSGWITATAAPYRQRTGVYALINPDTSAAWVPAAAMTACRVLWEVTPAAGDSPVYVQQIHEVVLSSITPMAKPSIATIADVKAYGAVGTATDLQIFNTLQLAQTIIQRYCRQPFRLIFRSDRHLGTGARVLLLPIPLWGLQALTINEESAALANTSVRVQGATGDDRWNPLVSFASCTRDIFARAYGDSQFSHRHYQTITGAWGFVEEDTQQAPPIVRDAAVRLAWLMTKNAAATGGSGAMPAPAGPLRSETTDGHSITYGAVSGSASSRDASFALLQQDAQVRDSLNLYRSPMQIAAPANEW